MAHKVSLPVGIWAASNTWFLGSTSPKPTRHLDRFIHFGRVHGHRQQTHRESERPRYIGNSRPHGILYMHYCVC